MDIYSEARNLIERYEKGDAFRLYLRRRLPLVILPLLLFLVFSVACSVGIIELMGTNRMLAFLAVLVTPFILIGSLFVQVYVFFSWLEVRALARMSARRHRPAKGARGAWLSNLRSRVGKPPPIPWGPVAVFVIAPFLLLALVSVKAAALLLAFAILTPILFSLLDRYEFGVKNSGSES